MMILRSSPSSPFARKVRIAVSVLGFDSEVKIEAADTNDPKDSLRVQNPLGKLPVLVLEDGTAIYDSRLIVEYLDHRAGGGKIIPHAGPERMAALRTQSLCDGVLDASILIIYESRWRAPERHEAKWVEHQAGKVTRALAALEAAATPLAPAPALPDIGQISLACVLGYRDFRFGGDWRGQHPRLTAWLDSFAARVPAFAATKPA